MAATGDLGEFEPPDKPPHTEWAKAEVVVGPDGGSLSTGVLSSPLDLSTDWNGVLRGFGLDPDIFEIADDTVKMGKWQQSKRLENGDRDTIWLYSYSARFTRRPPRLTATDIDALLKRLIRLKPQPLPKPDPGKGTPCTYLVNLADLQIGKSQGGGVEGAIERIESALDLSVQRLAALRKTHNIEHVVIANMGDPIEGCEGNYASQLHTVNASLRKQLNIAMAVLVRSIESHNADTFLSTLSNHSEWMRRGGVSVTGDSDSADGYLADQLKVLFEMAGRGPTTWHIPHDEMVTVADLSGVPVGFTHGHKIPSEAKEQGWLQAQAFRLLEEQGAKPRVWITAHRHNYKVQDFGPWFRFQCPSLDGGSKWFADLSGAWSTPGLLTMLIGQHDPRGWSDAAVL